MFKPQRQHIYEFISEDCDWRQACEWLETAWVPLPPGYEHFDKKRDNRIPIEETYKHPSYWRRSQVLAQAIKQEVLRPIYYDRVLINNLNNLTSNPDSRESYEIQAIVRDLMHTTFIVSFDHLAEVFKCGSYKIILDKTELIYRGYYLYLENDDLMFYVKGESKKIYSLNRSNSTIADVLKYLITKAPNEPVSFARLAEYSARIRNSCYADQGLRKLREAVIQNIKNAKYSRLTKDELDMFKSIFIYKDGTLSIKTDPYQ